VKHFDAASTSTRRKQVRPQPTRLRFVLVFLAVRREKCFTALEAGGHVSMCNLSRKGSRSRKISRSICLLPLPRTQVHCVRQ
jgi:hypothetical protein